MRKCLIFLIILFITSCSTTQTDKNTLHADMVLEIAGIYNEKGENDAERKVLESYIAEYGNSDKRVLYNLLLLYYSNGEYDKVIDGCNKFLENPANVNDIDFRRLLAFSFVEKKEYLKACDVYLGTISLDEVTEDDFLNAASAAQNAGDNALALGILKIGIEVKFILTKKMLETALSFDDTLNEYKILLDNII